MSFPTRIDYTAAVRMEASAHEAVLAWVCPVCGKVRVFEGGRPFKSDQQGECQKCGSPLYVPQSPAEQIRSFSLAW